MPRDVPGMRKIGSVGARLTDRIALQENFSGIPDHLAAAAAGHFSPCRAGQVKFIDFYADLLDSEQDAVRHSFISGNLPFGLGGEFGCVNLREIP